CSALANVPARCTGSPTCLPLAWAHTPVRPYIGIPHAGGCGQGAVPEAASDRCAVCVCRRLPAVGWLASLQNLLQKTVNLRPRPLKKRVGANVTQAAVPAALQKRRISRVEVRGEPGLFLAGNFR